MTGAGQGGTGKRHRTTAPLTPDPLRTQKSAETLPWTLLGATLVGALRKITRGRARRMSPPRPSPSNPNPKPSHETPLASLPSATQASSPGPKKVRLPLDTRWTVDLLTRTSVATRQKPHPAASKSMMRAPDRREHRVPGLSNPKARIQPGNLGFSQHLRQHATKGEDIICQHMSQTVGNVDPQGTFPQHKEKVPHHERQLQSSQIRPNRTDAGIHPMCGCSPITGKTMTTALMEASLWSLPANAENAAEKTRTMSLQRTRPVAPPPTETAIETLPPGTHPLTPRWKGRTIRGVKSVSA